ncbi:MAG TPA: FtsQ-type POTRA domain-containing protein [Pyrinomonadaceae bacterium]|nr:FtsQ-type POTRA domain-containing protein [Pyrinomonadaceae bacterium]
MREQVIAHKVGNRSGIGKHRRSSEATQRPTRRESGGAVLVTRLRSVLGYVPAFLKVVAAIVVGIVIFAGYRAAASASFFQIRKVEVQGTSRVSADEVESLVRREVEKTGVWKADLAELNARLEKLPWVRTAVVSRVLPDSIRVRITERVPRAVARTASGRFRWVDDDAVLLGEMLPTDQMPPFFLRGLNEDDPEGARVENRERVAKFLELQQAWDAAGLSERVSEVNVIDVRDIRAQLADDDSHIEVRLGSQDYGKRLKDALEVLDAQRQTPRGALISYIDLSQGKRAIVGLTSGAHANVTAASVGRSTESMGENTDRGPTVTTAREKAIAAVIRTSDSSPGKNRNDNSRIAEKKSDKTKKPERRKP